MSEIPHLPVVPLPGCEGWAKAYDWGEALNGRFPGQDGEDFAYACEYNDAGPATAGGVIGLVMLQQGENDGPDWIWRVAFADGTTWIATGGCDYTGWDCQSSLAWAQQP